MDARGASLLLGLLFLLGVAVGTRQCLPKHCVLLERCPVMLARLRSGTQAQRNSVKRAMCGYEGSKAKVCCPVGGPPDTELLPSQGVHTGRKRSPGRRPTALHKKMVTTDEPQSELNALLPEQCGRGSVRSRIFGGAATGLGSYPWIVAMRYAKGPEQGGLEKVLCAGSLISSRYVLTAAHCLDSARTKGWQLTSLSLGDWRLSTDPDCAFNTCAAKAIVAHVENTTISAEYNSTTLAGDIALVRLDKPVNFSRTVHPICLPPRTFAPGEVALGTTVVAIGWGMTKSFQNSDVLMEARLPIANPSICKERFPFNYHLNGKQMCAGGGSSDTCLGDSGGPVMKLNDEKKFYLLAVTSFGSVYCGTEGHPAVYTSVAHYSDWIRYSMMP